MKLLTKNTIVLREVCRDSIHLLKQPNLHIQHQALDILEKVGVHESALSDLLSLLQAEMDDELKLR